MRRWLEALASPDNTLESPGHTTPGVGNTITEVGHTREPAGHNIMGGGGTISGGGDTIKGVGHTVAGGGGGHTVDEKSAMAGAVDRVREKMLSWHDLKDLTDESLKSAFEVESEAGRTLLLSAVCNLLDESRLLRAIHRVLIEPIEPSLVGCGDLLVGPAPTTPGRHTTPCIFFQHQPF